MSISTATAAPKETFKIELKGPFPEFNDNPIADQEASLTENLNLIDDKNLYKHTI